jgi:hypothetical protein
MTKRFENRLKTLERKLGLNQTTVDTIVLTFVSPRRNGPADSGHAAAQICVGPNKGLKLYRESGEAKETFEQRVEAAKAGVCD